MSVTKPNFFIAGAGKAGSTSLNAYLAQHPDIFMSPFKEPNYFVPGYGYNNWNDYLALFDGASGETAVGEASTGYFYCQESPAWIKSTLGRVKIILMLRNPARRAASLYWWMVREGYEDAATFAEALELEPSRMQDQTFPETCSEFHHSYFYFTTGLYTEQVRRYLDTFGENNVRIYIFEEFAKDPHAICRDIFGFLGVDQDFEPAIAIHNEARLPASARLQFWLRNKAPRYLWFLPSRVRHKLLLRVMTLNIKKGSTPAHDVLLEGRLLQRYRDDIRQLEQLLHRDLSLWFDRQTIAEPSSDPDYVPVH